jgi:hypothetical protein
MLVRIQDADRRWARRMPADRPPVGGVQAAGVCLGPRRGSNRVPVRCRSPVRLSRRGRRAQNLSEPGPMIRRDLVRRGSAEHLLVAGGLVSGFGAGARRWAGGGSRRPGRQSISAGGADKRCRNSSGSPDQSSSSPGGSNTYEQMPVSFSREATISPYSGSLPTATVLAQDIRKPLSQDIGNRCVTT